MPLPDGGTAAREAQGLKRRALQGSSTGHLQKTKDTQAPSWILPY